MLYQRRSNWLPHSDRTSLSMRLSNFEMFCNCVQYNMPSVPLTPPSVLFHLPNAIAINVDCWKEWLNAMNKQYQIRVQYSTPTFIFAVGQKFNISMELAMRFYNLRACVKVVKLFIVLIYSLLVHCNLVLYSNYTITCNYHSFDYRNQMKSWRMKNVSLFMPSKCKICTLHQYWKHHWIGLKWKLDYRLLISSQNTN